MCKDKTPIEALGLEQPELQQLARWMGNTHFVGSLRGIQADILVAANFTPEVAQMIVEKVAAIPLR